MHRIRVRMSQSVESGPLDRTVRSSARGGIGVHEGADAKAHEGYRAKHAPDRQGDSRAFFSRSESVAGGGGGGNDQAMSVSQWADGGLLLDAWQDQRSCHPHNATLATAPTQAAVGGGGACIDP